LKTIYESNEGNFKQAYIFKNIIFRAGPRTPQLIDKVLLGTVGDSSNCVNWAKFRFIDCLIGNRVIGVRTMKCAFNVSLNFEACMRFFKSALNSFRSNRRNLVNIPHMQVKACQTISQFVTRKLKSYNQVLNKNALTR
jgi:hypothetical protein